MNSDEFLVIFENEDGQIRFYTKLSIFHNKFYDVICKKTNASQKKVFIQILNSIYLDNKDFIDSFYFVSKKFNTKIKFFVKYIDFDKLDVEDKFVKLFKTYKFKYVFPELRQHSDEMIEFAKNNLWARQMLIAFFAQNRKFDLLVKNRKWKWVLDDTPFFYMSFQKIIGENHSPRYYKYPFYRKQITSEWLKVFKYNEYGRLNIRHMPFYEFERYYKSLAIPTNHIYLTYVLLNNDKIPESYKREFVRQNCDRIIRQIRQLEKTNFDQYIMKMPKFFAMILKYLPDNRIKTKRKLQKFIITSAIGECY